MNAPPVIMWFRQDLRLTDNAALLAAIAAGGPVVPVYVLDLDAAGCWAPGGASRWWLHRSLAALAKDLERLGSRLIFQRGPTRTRLAQLAEKVGAEAVYCTRAYQPWARALEEELQSVLKADGRALKRYAGALLFEPEDLATISCVHAVRAQSHVWGSAAGAAAGSGARSGAVTLAGQR
jgi:deoxyribodipyrimidine photo-lyase